MALANISHLRDLAANRIFEKLLAWLGGQAVHQPRVARHHPADAVGRSAVVEQPNSRIHRGFACTYDAKLGGSDLSLFLVCQSCVKAFGATSRTPSATLNLGVCVDGTVGL